jgi:thioredoxin 1
MVAELLNIDAVHLAISAPSLTIIDCYAPWCGPCRTLAPVLDQFQKVFPQVHIYKLNVDEVDPASIKFVGGGCEVSALPTLLFCKDGALVDMVVGLNVGKIEEAIKKHM